MLQFLRKHQKIFFGLVAIVTIASLAFFGNSNNMQSAPSIPDRRLGSLIDASPLMHQEVELLVRFISTSPEEHGWLEKGQIPNLFNDGVVQKDFLQTGLLALATEPYNFEINSEIVERMQRARSYRHYMHPQAPFVSAEAVWNQFAPTLKQKVEKLQGAKTSDEALNVLAELYLEQQKLPSDVLRRVLTFQEKQYQWLAHDQKLDHANLDMFGFQTLEDWFGPKTMRLIAQFILNGAAEARRQGYHVSEQEARRSLEQNLYLAAKKTLSEHDLTGQDLHKLYRQQLHALQRDEKNIIELWQKVLEFRSLLEGIGSSVVVSEEDYQQFSGFACEKLRVDSYELPESLRLKSFRELLKLQTYLEATAGTPTKKISASLHLPQVLAPAGEIAHHTPELVEYRYSAEMAEVTNEALASRITLKEIYTREIDEAHWEQLKQEFPLLSPLAASTHQERYAALESVEAEMRRRIDQFTREAIVREHPEWIENAFVDTERKQVSFSLRKQGGQLPFIGVTNRDELHAMLKMAPLKNATSDEGLPLRFDTDELHHYEIMLLQPPSDLTLLSFEEVSKDGTLDALLDKKLEEAYPEVRKKNSAFFQASNGAWKPFAEVKDHVGAYVYADLLKAIETIANQAGVTWPKAATNSRGIEPLDLYAQYRMYAHANEALKAISQEGSDKGWVAEKSKTTDEQWSLVKKEKEMTRAQLQDLQLGLLFDNCPSWSSVLELKTAASSWSFIHAKEKIKPSRSEIDEMVKIGQKSLANDAKRNFIKSLRAEIVEKKALVFSPAEDVL